MIAMAGSQFPRVCNACRRRYADFKQFVKETKPVGAPTLSVPLDPIGMLTWSNCACGNTLVLLCEDRQGVMHSRFGLALESEAQATGRSTEELLLAIRAEVHLRMLGDV